MDIHHIDVPVRIKGTLILDEPSVVYTLVGDTQIHHDAVVTIGPNVTIVGNGFKLISYGKLTIHNTKLTNVHLAAGVHGDVTLVSVDIDGGSLFSVNNGNYCNAMSISNCHIRNVRGIRVTHTSDVMKDTVIQKNIFENCGRIEVYAHNRHVVISNNVFLHGQSDCAVYGGINTGNSKTIIERNSFYDAGIAIIANTDYVNITAPHNYWHNTSPEDVPSKLVDGRVDFSLTKEIEYLPMLDAPDADTPSFLNQP